MSSLYSYSDAQIKFAHLVDLHPQDKDFPMHIHELYEIFCFVSGNASYLVEGNEYPLEPGSIVTMCKTETHRIKILGGEPYERFTLHFSPALLDGVDPQRLLLQIFHDHPLGQNNLYRPSELKGERPLALLQAMCTPNDTAEERRLAVIANLLPLFNLLRNRFLKKQIQPESASRSLAEEIVAYINRHLFEELSLESLSRHFFLSPSQLGRLFKEATGSSVWNYILTKRLLTARSKIRAGASFGEAAHACGFHDYSSFYRAYRHQYHTSPKNDFLHEADAGPLDVL